MTNNLGLTWRDVLDPKSALAGDHIIVPAEMAYKIGYRFLAWNGQVYRVFMNRQNRIDWERTEIPISEL